MHWFVLLALLGGFWDGWDGPWGRHQQAAPVTSVGSGVTAMDGGTGDPPPPKP